MRTISLIIVHCSANKRGSALRLADIDRWHRSLGWKGCGYHFVIPTDGTVEEGRPIERIGAHCRFHNRHSIGICYIAEAQRKALRKLLYDLRRRFPRALIVGHRDLDPTKACPCFDVVREYGEL